VLKKGCDFISVANFGPDMEANKENTFKNFLLKSVDSDLTELVGMVKAGALKLPVDSVMDFKDVPAALTKSLGMQAAGKIVIKINP
jgi:NADPH:quinone reductase-like Zn-dependent oxidoreductase